MKSLYGPTSLAVQSKSADMPYGSLLPFERIEGDLQLNEVFDMKPVDFMQERESLVETLVSDSSLSNDARFNSRKMPIRHLRSSSDNSFGFSMAVSICIGCCCLGIFPVFLLGTS